MKGIGERMSNYQPVYGQDIESHRGNANHERRWKAIEPYLRSEQPLSVLDYGCNHGYFSFKAAEMGHCVVGYDRDKDVIEKAQVARGQTALPLLMYFSSNADDFDGKTVSDSSTSTKQHITFLLSVLHHMIEQLGEDEALLRLHNFTSGNAQLFLDMGQLDEQRNDSMTWYRHLEKAGWQNPLETIPIKIMEATEFNKFNLISSTPIHGTKRLLFRFHNEPEPKTLYDGKGYYKVNEYLERSRGSQNLQWYKGKGSFPYLPKSEPRVRYYDVRKLSDGSRWWVKEYGHNVDYPDKTPEQLAKYEHDRWFKAYFHGGAFALKGLEKEGNRIFMPYCDWPNLYDAEFTGQKEALLDEAMHLVNNVFGGCYDLSPNNILHKDGEYVFIDFELAECNPEQRLAQLRKVLGVGK